MPDTRAKALTYLRNGAVHILHARTPADQRRPVEVVAAVEAHTGVRRVELRPDQGWTCTCPDVGDCAHIAAVALVTGHESAAARPAKASAA